MTPKEKAQNLFNSYSTILLFKSVSKPEIEQAKKLSLSAFAEVVSEKTNLVHEVAKECAIFLVDEILKDSANGFNEDMRNYEQMNNYEHTRHCKYWKDVKQELENL